MNRTKTRLVVFVALTIFSGGLIGCLHSPSGAVSSTAAAKNLSTNSSKPIQARTAGSLVVFAFGKENGTEYDLKNLGFTGIEDYACTVGVDCSAAKFPAHLYRPSATQMWDPTGVARVTINFELKRDYRVNILRLSRWGAETNVVTLDGSKTFMVTNQMLGSDEGVHGVYDLDVGPLKAGRHSISISVAEDGKANGRMTFDAIRFYSHQL